MKSTSQAPSAKVAILLMVADMVRRVARLTVRYIIAAAVCQRPAMMAMVRLAIAAR